MSAGQKRELWSRWKAGESLSEIGRALGKQPGSIHGVVASNGGYVPARRCRSLRVLSLAEREEISRGLAEGVSLRMVAVQLQRAPSTVSREVARRFDKDGDGLIPFADLFEYLDDFYYGEDPQAIGTYIAGIFNTKD